MQNYTKLLQDAVITARSEAEYTQAYVAELAGVDVRTIINIEKGRGNPKLQVLYRLITALGIDSREIFNPDMDLEDPHVRQFRLLTKDCSEQEIESILHIVKTVIETMQSNN